MTAQEIPNVGQRIRTIREAQGHSLRALAERSGLSLNAISLIERGENSPTVSSLHPVDPPLADIFFDQRLAGIGAEREVGARDDHAGQIFQRLRHLLATDDVADVTAALAGVDANAHFFIVAVFRLRLSQIRNRAAPHKLRQPVSPAGGCCRLYSSARSPDRPQLRRQPVQASSST